MINMKLIGALDIENVINQQKRKGELKMRVFEIPDSTIFDVIFDFDHIEVDIKTVAATEHDAYHLMVSVWNVRTKQRIAECFANAVDEYDGFHIKLYNPSARGVLRILNAADLYSQLVDKDYEIDHKDYMPYEQLMGSLTLLKQECAKDKKKRVVTRISKSGMDIKEVK